MSLVVKLSEVGLGDVDLVGGKNASLGQMIQSLSALGIRVPGGFAVTAKAYRHFVESAGLQDEIDRGLAEAKASHEALAPAARRIRSAMLAADLPDDLVEAVRTAYAEMASELDAGSPHVAVRSSATAEDLPNASFAGQQDTYLHIHGDGALLDAVKRCFASLFTARAISYRRDLGFADASVALSVAVQHMVRSDHGASGVIFTLDTDSGHRDFVLITSAYGLGENVVQGKVGPDEFYVHKPTLASGYRAVVRRKIGAKEMELVYDPRADKLTNLSVAEERRQALSVDDDDVLTLARWAVSIEEHYSEQYGKQTPMDIEWAKDGESGELFVVQARPETVHSQKDATTGKLYHLEGKGEVIGEGLAIGDAIGSGTARVIASATEIARFQDGEVLVTDSTDPDWEPIMKRAGAIVTERGGRTSHAAIVARELGIPAVVAVEAASARIDSGAEVTVSCAEGETGHIYAGRLPFRVETIDATDLPDTRTKVMLNLAQPDLAFKMAGLPCDGVGLARMEFVFASWVGVHPLALTRPDELDYETRRKVEEHTRGYDSPREFFIDRLGQGIATLSAAMWPRPVILRFSDFKTNEYASLLGGAPFEPHEENPMIGWRGASRYYHPAFKDGFLLEAEAIRRVRDDLGLSNLKLMVPFCRTPQEGEKVLATIAEVGLERGKNDLEVYVMAEIPSNVLLATEFAELFDGFSIGSNDLTQLVLGVDRDSDRVAPLFDERNLAVKRACSMLIGKAHDAGRHVGICGQAPSDYPEFAEFLVGEGIDSISVVPDAVIRTRRLVAGLEKKGPQ